MPESEAMNEGIWAIPTPGEYDYGPTQQGGGYQGWGGTADASPSPSSSASYGYVVSGGPTNFDPVQASSAATADRAQYYSGYWAGVEGALYGFGPPAAAPVHSSTFEPFDVLGLTNPGIPQSTPQAQGLSLPGPQPAYRAWVSPAEDESWDMGSGGDARPPDLGTPAFGPNLPHNNPFRDMSGSMSDIPTEQQIQDAGNPATWLRPSGVDPATWPGSSEVVGPATSRISAPTFMAPDNVQVRALFPDLSSSGPWLGSMTPILDPFDVSPGQRNGAITPENIPSGFTGGNPNAMPGLLEDSGGPYGFFGIF